MYIVNKDMCNQIYKEKNPTTTQTKSYTKRQLNNTCTGIYDMYIVYNSYMITLLTFLFFVCSRWVFLKREVAYLKQFFGLDSSAHTNMAATLNVYFVFLR